MYDPDFPADLGLDGLDFEAQDLVEASRARRARATAALVDLQDDEEAPVEPDLFEVLYAEGSSV